MSATSSVEDRPARRPTTDDAYHERPSAPASRRGTRRGAPASAANRRRPRPQPQAAAGRLSWPVVAVTVAIVVVVGAGVIAGVQAMGAWLFPPAEPEAVAPAADENTGQSADDTEDSTTEDEEAAATGPASTPRSAWRQGTIPVLYQTDPAWADEPYAGGTMAKNGCGVTCLAMVYIALTGDTSLGPVEMAAYSEENGYVEDSSTSWRFMQDGAAALGLTVRTLPNVAADITSELEAGHPIIVNVAPGTFTEVGHYLVLTGVDTDGRVRMHNPNAPEDNEVSWDLSVIMNDARNYWAYSA